MAKKKSTSVLAVLGGLALAGAALFLSKKENREKVKKTAVKTASALKQVSKEIEKDPQKFLNKTKQSAQKAVKRLAKK